MFEEKNSLNFEKVLTLREVGMVFEGGGGVRILVSFVIGSNCSEKRFF